MKDIPTQVDGVTSLAAADFNQIPDELENAITVTGQTLDGGNLNQLSKTILNLGMNAGFNIDSGTPNNIVLGNASNPTPSSYRDGIVVTFKAAATNTGATTINLAGLGTKSVKMPNGADPFAEYITAGKYYMAIFNSGSDTFIASFAFGSGLTGTKLVSGNTIYFALQDNGIMTQYGTLNAPQAGSDNPPPIAVNLAFSYIDTNYNIQITVKDNASSSINHPFAAAIPITSSQFKYQAFYNISTNNYQFLCTGRVY